PRDVAAAVVDSLGRAFPDSVAVVVLDMPEGRREVRTSTTRWRNVVSNAELIDEICRRSLARRRSLLLERTPALEAAYLLSGRRLRALHCMPMQVPDAQSAGGVAILRPDEAPLEPSEWALLASFAQQAAQAFERSQRFERDHDLAVRLQRSL